MLQNPRSKLAALSKMHKDVLAASHFEGDFCQHFISFPDFFMTDYASLSKYLSKKVRVVIQVVSNKKVMAKTPREANLCGNWCVHKGLIFAWGLSYDLSKFSDDFTPFFQLWKTITKSLDKN